MVDVRDVLYIMSDERTPLGAINERNKLEVVHEDDVISTLTVDVMMTDRYYGEVEADQRLLYRDNIYMIREVEYDKDGRCAHVKAEIEYIDLNNYIRTYNHENKTLREVCSWVLEGTGGWSLGTVDADIQGTGLHDVNVISETALSILRYMAIVSGLKLRFDTLSKKVNFINPDKLDVGFLFRYGKNLQQIKRKVKSPEATALVSYGKDGLKIDSVNPTGKEYIENYDWHMQHYGITFEQARARYLRTQVWEDTRFIKASTLFREAKRKLASMARPIVSYETTVANVSQEIKIGDVGYIVDEDTGTKQKTNIVRYVERENRDESEIELAHSAPGLAESVLANGVGGGKDTGVGSRVAPDRITNSARYDKKSDNGGGDGGDEEEHDSALYFIFGGSYEDRITNTPRTINITSQSPYIDTKYYMGVLAQMTVFLERPSNLPMDVPCIVTVKMLHKKPNASKPEYVTGQRLQLLPGLNPINLTSFVPMVDDGEHEIDYVAYTEGLDEDGEPIQVNVTNVDNDGNQSIGYGYILHAY